MAKRKLPPSPIDRMGWSGKSRGIRLKSDPVHDSYCADGLILILPLPPTKKDSVMPKHPHPKRPRPKK